MKRIIQSISNFTLQILTALFLIIPSVQAQSPQTITAPMVTTDVNLNGIVNTVVQIVFGVALFLFLVLMATNGISYITAGDDQKKIRDAKSGFTNAIVGLVIVLLAFAGVKFIAMVLGFETDKLWEIIPASLGLTT